MSEIPDNLQYAKSHEWLRVDDGIDTIGITDHAQHELTDIVFVELPDVGKQLDAGAAGTLKVLDQDLARKSGQDVKRFMEQEDDFGQLEFDALMRKIDRLDDSYRL